MAERARVYVDACCFIDLAKQVKGVQLSQEKDDDAWYSKRLIEAAKDGKLELYTSAFTQVECIGIKQSDDKDSPMIFDADVRRLFDSLLASGKSGVIPVQPSYFISKAARDLYWESGITCKPADRLHIATAISRGCAEFLTVDGRIGVAHRKKINAVFGLDVIRPKDTVHLPHEYRQLKIENDEAERGRNSC